MNTRPSAVLVAAVATLALASCGPVGSDSPDLDVSAASSLKEPLTRLSGRYDAADLRIEFAGSDRIAAAIEAGRLPDVVVLAGSKAPNRLLKQGTIARPVAIASNRLVVAVPAHGGKVGSVDDLAKPGLRVALGSPTVPVGAYADAVIARLSPAVARGLAANVKTREADAAGVVGKLTEGAVDAAIVYRTDVLASNGKLKAIAIPERLAPEVVYEAAVVNGTDRPAESEALVASLRGGSGHRTLMADGFLPPPAGR